MPLLTFFPVVMADAAVAAAATGAAAAAGPNTNTRKNYKSIRQRNAKCAHVMQAAAATPATATTPATVATVAATFLEYVTQPQLWTVDTGLWTMDTGLGAVLEATLELKPGLSRLKL